MSQKDKINEKPVEIFRKFKFNELLTEAISHNNYLKLPEDRAKNSNLIGYIVQVSYDEAVIVTNDSYIMNNLGISKSSFLIATINNSDFLFDDFLKHITNESIENLNERDFNKKLYNDYTQYVNENIENKKDLKKLRNIPDNFLLLKVKDTAPVPLSKENEQMMFEWYKKITPDLDLMTNNDLQWTSFKCSILGQYYPSTPSKAVEKKDEKYHIDGHFEFSSDLNFVLSPIRYTVYKPTKAIFDTIINNQFNSLKESKNIFEMGHSRPTESRLINSFEKDDTFTDSKKTQDIVKFKVDASDFVGRRTAVFGKTRLGKSNSVKILIENISRIYKDKVGQLIFDINGEYANKNKNDITCIYDKLTDKRPNSVDVYAVGKLQNKSNHVKNLGFNFYQEPNSAIALFRELIDRDSQYIKSFLSTEFALSSDITEMLSSKKFDEVTHEMRKLQIFWSILSSAGYSMEVPPYNNYAPNTFKHKYSPSIGEEKMGILKNTLPEDVFKTLEKYNKSTDLQGMIYFYLALARSMDNTTVADMFVHEKSLLGMLVSSSSQSGFMILKEFQSYHTPRGQDSLNEIYKSLSTGKTVIIDLSVTNNETMEYYSKKLCSKIFNEQMKLFTHDDLDKSKFIQIYFEEAHNLFSQNDKLDSRNIYARIAKEGAKYNIGMVYSTQSPSTIMKELLNQTENFFIVHISSPSELTYLANLNYLFEDVKDEIMRSKVPGYMRVLTFSHKFIIPVQIYDFNKTVDKDDKNAI